MRKDEICIEGNGFKRVLNFKNNKLFTIDYKDINTDDSLIENNENCEGCIKINGHDYYLGEKEMDNCFGYKNCEMSVMSCGGNRLEIVFEKAANLPEGVGVSVIFEAPATAPVLIKHIKVFNYSKRAIRLDGMLVEEIYPRNDKKRGLLFENDYVRGAMKKNGEDARSPWIENQSGYVNEMLTPPDGEITFSYPEMLDRWILSGCVFSSLKVYEFIVPVEKKERGLAFRKATRHLFPHTTRIWLSCALAPARNISEYYEGIDKAAQAGYRGVYLHHGWIKGELTSPLFTTYADYELKPELFPNGWSDVRKMTGYAHEKGLEISFYTIYVSMWDGMKSKAVSDNNWELVWDPEDKSSRWGTTLCPGTGWGGYVNRQIEDAIVKGGFDAWHLDGPYYGDVSIAENRPYRPGGPNQLLAWEKQTEFYSRMQALGIHGESAQGFCAFAHGANRINTTGYDEMEFKTLSILDQILATRKGAYIFTKIYRPEQATTFIPVVSWLNGPDMEPMEENYMSYNMYLANCFGYGFPGKCYQRVPYEGPESKKVLLRWLDFWKKYEDYFINGYIVHCKEPDGKNIDGILHVKQEEDNLSAVLVVYNSNENPVMGKIKLPSGQMLPDSFSGYAISEGGKKIPVMDSVITVEIPKFDATWYDIKF